MTDAPGDRLAAINDELRGQADVYEQTPWLPLESNPEIFSNFGHQIGMPARWRFVDVLGLDPELLAMAAGHDRKVAALILLFPCSHMIYSARAEEDQQLARATESGSSGSKRKAEGESSAGGFTPRDDAFFLVQHAGFGNACGTIAAIHAISNARGEFGGFESGDGGGGGGGAVAPLGAFCDATAGVSPAERGRALQRARELKGISDCQAAHNPAAQTSCPARDGPDLDHHFVAFSLLRGGERGEARLVELDGTKRCAIDHGAAEELASQVEGGGGAGACNIFLSAAGAVIRKRFMEVDPSNIEFSLMALCEADD